MAKSAAQAFRDGSMSPGARKLFSALGGNGPAPRPPAVPDALPVLKASQGSALRNVGGGRQPQAKARPSRRVVQPAGSNKAKGSPVKRGITPKRR